MVMSGDVATTGAEQQARVFRKSEKAICQGVLDKQKRYYVPPQAVTNHLHTPNKTSDKEEYDALDMLLKHQMLQGAGQGCSVRAWLQSPTSFD